MLWGDKFYSTQRVTIIKETLAFLQKKTHLQRGALLSKFPDLAEAYEQETLENIKREHLKFLSYWKVRRHENKS